MPIDETLLTATIAARLQQRNKVSQTFFPQEAWRLAKASQQMATCFLQGGRLLAFGNGPYTTDAQHISVEFVHPVIVGKRALPALDISLRPQRWVDALLRPDDMVVGFGPPTGDPLVDKLLSQASSQGIVTFALPGKTGDYSVPYFSDDPFLHQEILEILYHTLWETVHVFFEHREQGHDVGASGFLYPYLGKDHQDTQGIVQEVADSILAKAREDEKLRDKVAQDSSARIAAAALAIQERLNAGGQIICFGNGGSATDANDLALDCIDPPASYHPVPAISLALEAPNLSAVANDIGSEALFLRQLIAQGRPEDVALAISTSGGSANIIAALKEARQQNMLTVALLGYDGGEIARQQLADITLVVPSDYIPRIQEIHASIYHIIRELLEEIRHG